MGCCLSTRPAIDVPTGVADTTECAGDEENSGSSSVPSVSAMHPHESNEITDLVQPGNLHPGSAMHLDGNEDEMVITSIRATDLALGLGRIPAGFYAVVHHRGLEWRTENKRLLVNDDIVEWGGRPISIPFDPLATICLEVYASFEFQPVLGAGEQLRKLTVSIEQLFDRSAKSVPFILFPKDGNVVSPCSSISVTVERRKCESEVSAILGSCSSATESHGDLEDATNKGHGALLRYQRHGRKQDLESSIEEFGRAFSICPLDHPCRAAAQSNLALAKLIFCQIDETCVSLDSPLDLYRDALTGRPTGHADRPFTLIQLATVFFARFEKQGDEADISQARALLHEALELGPAESHEYRAANFMLQLHEGLKTFPAQAGESLTKHHPISRQTGEDPYTLGTRLVKRFQQSGDTADLQQAILLLEESVRSIPVEDHRRHAGLVNLAAALFYRFSRLGKPSDLEEAILKQKGALDLIVHDHPDRPGYLNNLSTYFLTRFQFLGDLNDIEAAIVKQKDAIDLTPHGHADRPGYLTNLGNSFQLRFERFGELDDLEEAISRYRDAVDLIRDDHPDKPACLNNLGISIRARFDRLGGLNDLQEAISRHRDAVDLTPHSHPDKPARLSNLGISVISRFNHVGELGDLEEAILRHRDAVELTPDGVPDKPGRLTSLGISLVARFNRLGELCDLEEAISRHRDAAELTPDGHPNKPGRLSNLGNCNCIRFHRLGEVKDLEEAILMHRKAADITPYNHPDKPARLNNLGNSIRARFDLLGELADLEEAISSQRGAVDLTPYNHPDRSGRLSNLGNSFRTRFERLGELDDLDEAISRQMEAVNLAPQGHPEKPACLANLGNSFLTRFTRLGELSDLSEAILRHRHAVDLTFDGHISKPGRLSNLGTSLTTHFHRIGELSNLEEAISKQVEAVKLTPHGDPDKPGRLNNLGNSFLARFNCLGQLSDLDEAILNHRRAVHLTQTPGHPDKPKYLSNLGSCLKTRFDHLGELNDLDEAFSSYSDAVDLTPHDHPDRPGQLSNLGNIFSNRFGRLGQLSDIEEAISRHRDAIELTPNGHPDKPARLNNLGNSVRARFDRLGELSDLEEAISRHRDAIDLVPDGHPSKPVLLDNFGTSIRIRFDRLGSRNDLEEAISRQKQAIDLTPPGHSLLPGYFNSLGKAIFARFEHNGELSDLGEAISSHRHAVDLTPKDHPSRLVHLDDLGNCYDARFKSFGKLSDLEEAISSHKDTVSLIPHGHPNESGCLNHLALSFFSRFLHLKQLRDLEEAISLFSHAASTAVGPITVRFTASQNWISCARAVHHHSLLDAFSTAISLLPQLAWIGFSLRRRYHELVRGANVVREAAAVALDSGLPETAVEWLEQGRSIVWGELFQLRSSYQELSSSYPDHARRLRELSAALEQASAAREKSLTPFPEQRYATESLQQEADRHRTLAIERDGLLQEIRSFPGFKHFLLHKEFSQLRASAHSGPVVILNAAESRCDALIVLADVERVVHVPLPDVTFQRSADLQSMLKGLLGHARVIPSCDERAGKIASQDRMSWESLLSTLWNGVVKPVLDALAFSTPGDLARIFWCPTGPFVFLPIHAAGLYGTEYAPPGHKVSDFVVSSYVPTLSILSPSPRGDVAPIDGLRLLAVRQPSSDGLSHLMGVNTELEHIKAIIKTTDATLLESDLGSVEEVLGLMKDADWVHFACHGVQDATSPTDSGLCLADGRRLTVSDIIASSERPRGSGLAFLSACQTAMGDEGLKDEAVHVAAGMLFAGYGGVVGTMWSISDRLAPCVARDVYGQLFRSGRPDHRGVARALHEAVGGARNDGASFVEWLPFIHVGL